MKNSALLLLVAVLLAGRVGAERVIGTVWQPLSLLGTELDGKPLPDEPGMAVVIEPRPYLFRAGIFEEVVAAVGTPHHLAGADPDFPKESNLLVLLKGKVTGEFGDAERTIQIDLSATTKEALEDHGVTFHQFAKLILKCVSKNLQVNGQVQHEGKFPIEWKLPKFGASLRAKLPKQFIFKS